MANTNYEWGVKTPLFIRNKTKIKICEKISLFIIIIRDEVKIIFTGGIKWQT